MQHLPAAFPTDALKSMIDGIRAGEFTTPTVVEAAWNVEGYALCVLVGSPGQQSPQVLGASPQAKLDEIPTDEEAIALAEQIHGYFTEIGSKPPHDEKGIVQGFPIPMATLIKLALKILLAVVA